MFLPLSPRNVMEGFSRKWRVSCGNLPENCHKSPFSRGNRACAIGNLCHFAQIFHGHFCQLVENHGFFKSWSQKGVPSL